MNDKRIISVQKKIVLHKQLPATKPPKQDNVSSYPAILTNEYYSKKDTDDHQLALKDYFSHNKPNHTKHHSGSNHDSPSIVHDSKIKSISVKKEIVPISKEFNIVPPYILSPKPLNYPKIKDIKETKQSANSRNYFNRCVDSFMTNNTYIGRLDELKRTPKLREDFDKELVKKWLNKKLANEENNHNKRNQVLKGSFTDNESSPPAKHRKAEKKLKPIDDSLAYLKNVYMIDYKKILNIDSNIASSSKNFMSNGSDQKKKEILTPIKVKSQSKLPSAEKQNSNKIMKKNTKSHKSSHEVQLIYKPEKLLSNMKTEHKDVKYSYFAKSRQGMNKEGLKKINQDSYLMRTSLLNVKDYSLFGVLDGHGTNGHYVSNNTKELFIEYFSRTDYFMYYPELSNKNIYVKLKENDYTLVKSVFSNIENDAKSFKFDVNYSGTTANIVMLLGNKLICANCGDSRAILVKKHEDKSITPSNSMHLLKVTIVNQNEYNCEVIPLSQDHKPEIESEKKRILSQNGRVEQYKNDDGPFRVWLKNEDSPGLAMSRSIGDFLAKSVGVISDPDIFETEINHSSMFVVIASDGIWEFLSNEEVSEIVTPFYFKNDINGAVDRLVEDSVKHWKKEEEVIDDITALVIFFHK